MARDPMPDVIVLLPGISGSRLRRGERTVWGVAASAIGRMLATGGASMSRDLSLPEDPLDRDDLGDGIVADAVIQDLHLLPGLWKIDGYSKVADTIRAVFDVEDGRNFFEFPYDWRRDNRIAARRLAVQCESWLKNWRDRSGNRDARLILVAHSMGGLVARYFLECLEGWKLTRALMTFGTPFRGSLNALNTLSNGMKMGPLDLIDLSVAARTFTAIYQLLPIYRCYDAGDGELVRLVDAVTGTNIDPSKPQAALDGLRLLHSKGGVRDGVLPNVDSSKVLEAAIFHYEILAAAEANASQEDYRRGTYRLFPVIGIGQTTAQSARLEGPTVCVSAHYQDRDFGGDGTVPRVSAEPSGRETARDTMFAGTKHGSLQNADAVLLQLRGALNSLYLDLGAFMGVPSPALRVALDVPDLAWEDERIVVHARPETDDTIALNAVVRRATSDDPVCISAMGPVGEGAFEAVLSGLPPGTYNVRVVGGDGADVEPAEDSFAVAARQKS
jgi:pimeloyl-ACP methyl ester carboxylesterase